MFSVVFVLHSFIMFLWCGKNVKGFAMSWSHSQIFKTRPLLANGFWSFQDESTRRSKVGLGWRNKLRLAYFIDVYLCISLHVSVYNVSKNYFTSADTWVDIYKICQSGFVSSPVSHLIKYHTLWTKMSHMTRVNFFFVRITRSFIYEIICQQICKISVFVVTITS